MAGRSNFLRNRKKSAYMVIIYIISIKWLDSSPARVKPDRGKSENYSSFSDFYQSDLMSLLIAALLLTV